MHATNHSFARHVQIVRGPDDKKIYFSVFNGFLSRKGEKPAKQLHCDSAYNLQEKSNEHKFPFYPFGYWQKLLSKVAL